MKVFLLLMFVFSLFACQKKEDYIKVSCPSEKQVIEGLQKFNPELYIKVEKVQQFDKAPLCEVEFWAGVKYAVLYTDPKAKYFFPTAFDTSNGENVGLQKVSKGKKIPKDILELFEKHVNFVVGQGENYIYFIAEPGNERVEETYKNILQWAKEKNIRIKIIVRPMEFNVEGYNIALSVLCDKKDFEDMLKGYYNPSANCENGRKTIDENMRFITFRMGLAFPNPILITNEGKIWIGQINKDNFEMLLKNKGS